MRTQNIIIRSDTLAQAMNKSERIQRGVVFWLAIMVVSILTIINPTTRDDGLVFVASTVGFIVSILAIVLSALRVYHLKALIPPPGEPPPDEPPATPPFDSTFQQSHRPGAVGIERRQANTITLGKFRLTRRQWRALVTELKRHRKGNVVGWSRRKIEKHAMPEIDGTDWEVFTGLTARNEYGETKFAALTDELQGLDVVNEAVNEVTETGWTELCRLAGVEVVL